jgi:hypothetical protein
MGECPAAAVKETADGLARKFGPTLKGERGCPAK